MNVTPPSDTVKVSRAASEMLTAPNTTLSKETFPALSIFMAVGTTTHDPWNGNRNTRLATPEVWGEGQKSGWVASPLPRGSPKPRIDRDPAGYFGTYII